MSLQCCGERRGRIKIGGGREVNREICLVLLLPHAFLPLSLAKMEGEDCAALSRARATEKVEFLLMLGSVLC